MSILVHRNLRGVWLRGTLPTGPAIWVSNHHSWWDFFVAAVALRTAGRSDIWVLVEPGNVGNDRLFRSAGAIPATELRRALARLATGGVLVVFAEGELRPQGPVTATKSGPGWLARRSGAPMITVATRVLLRGHQAPEAYLDVTAPATDDAAELTLASAVQRLDGELSRADPERPLPGFHQVVAGTRSWHERFGGAMVTR